MPTRPFTRSQAKLLQDVHLHLTWKGLEEDLGEGSKIILWSALDEGSIGTSFRAIQEVEGAPSQAGAPKPGGGAQMLKGSSLLQVQAEAGGARPSAQTMLIMGGPPTSAQDRPLP